MEEKVLKELDKVVSLTGIKSRSGETFTTALIHRLQEMKEIGAVGHTREVVISVPKNLLETDKSASIFVKKAGLINRNIEFNMPVIMEPKGIKDKDNNSVVLLDFVFSVSKDTNIDAVITYLEA